MGEPAIDPQSHRPAFDPDRGWTRVLLASVVLVLVSGLAAAQIKDQVIVHALDPQAKEYKVYRFDRKLHLLGATDPSSEGSGGLDKRSPVAVDASGTYWITFDPLSTKKLLRVDADGTLLPSALLGYNPVGVLAAESGTVYALTRIPLQSPGPLYAVAPGGAALWSSWDAPILYTDNYPEHIIATPSGEIWLAGATRGPTGLLVPYPLVTRIDPLDGSVLESVALPWLTEPENSTLVAHFAGAPDGTMWVSVKSWNVPVTFFHMDGGTTLDVVPQPLTANTWDSQLRIDAAGNILAISSYNLWSEIVVFSAVDGSVLASHDLGSDLDSRIVSFALGPTGEDLIATTQEGAFVSGPDTYRIVRLNLVTGMRSTRVLPNLQLAYVPNGDPTGFIHANVTDQSGDDDGDGASNREETVAGSNPFDSTSRPDGAKVYLSFEPADAPPSHIRLVYRDPDGILDPVAGLDLSTLSLVIDGYGEVFPLLLSYLTSVSLSPDGTEATADFGALNVPWNLELEMEARVADLTGAGSFDWLITPPGDE